MSQTGCTSFIAKTYFYNLECYHSHGVGVYTAGNIDLPAKDQNFHSRDYNFQAILEVLSFYHHDICESGFEKFRQEYGSHVSKFSSAISCHLSPRNRGKAMVIYPGQVPLRYLGLHCTQGIAPDQLNERALKNGYNMAQLFKRSRVPRHGCGTLIGRVEVDANAPSSVHETPGIIHPKPVG